jgi:cobalt-zinc-cadmium efflux system membrane fusion protein
MIATTHDTSTTATAPVPPPPSRAGAAAVTRGRRAVVFAWVRRVLGVLGIVGCLAGAAWAYHVQQEKKASGPAPKVAVSRSVRVERTGEDTLSVPADVVASLGIKTAPAKAATEPRPLPPLQGVVGWDNSRLTRVYSTFPGIVVALGTTDKGETDRPFGDTSPRPLRNGDKVEADQLLAVVWSKDLGEKKSELIDAVSQLKANRETLNNLKSVTDGIIARKDILAAEVAVRQSENAVAKAVDTLRAWRLPEAEIQALLKEAEKLGGGEARRELTSGKTWARVEIRAPFAGVIVEKNTNVRNVVDTSTPLFQVADLSQLAVWMQIFEDDLPLFRDLMKSGKPIPWEIRLPSQPGFRRAGTLEQVGDIIDPTQHTALASGTVDNRGGDLRIGQFVTATVMVKPESGEVEIPTAALIEDGRQSVVFVQPDPKVPVYSRRTVAVARRYFEVVYLTGDAVRPGELVVTGGALQLNQALTDAPAPPSASPATN